MTGPETCVSFDSGPSLRLIEMLICKRIGLVFSERRRTTLLRKVSEAAAAAGSPVIERNPDGH